MSERLTDDDLTVLAALCHPTCLHSVNDVPVPTSQVLVPRRQMRALLAEVRQWRRALDNTVLYGHAAGSTRVEEEVRGATDPD